MSTSTKPIQVDEVSSSSEQIERLMRNVLYPSWSGPSLPRAHTVYFRNLTYYICSLIQGNKYTCTLNPQEQPFPAVHLDFGPIDPRPRLQVRLEERNGWTKVRCNLTGNGGVDVPSMTYHNAYSMIFDAFLYQTHYRLDRFFPKIVLSTREYPRNQFYVINLVVDMLLPEIDSIMAFWIPKLSYPPKMIHVGPVDTEENIERFQHLYYRYFTQVNGIDCSGAPLRVACSLYRDFRVIHLFDSPLPISLFFKWVKRWLACRPNVRHIKEIAFEPRGLLLNDRVLAKFLNYEPKDYMIGSAYAVRDAEGRQAKLYFSKYGVLVFQTDGVANFTYRTRRDGCVVFDGDIDKHSRMFHDFPVNETDFPDEAMRDGAYGPVSDYATVLPNYEPRNQ